VPGDQDQVVLRDDATAGPVTRVTVSAVDRSGNESERVTIDTGVAAKTPGATDSAKPEVGGAVREHIEPIFRNFLIPRSVRRPPDLL
jgi:hypothetical protein